MPQLGAKCVAAFNQSLGIASATETLWLTAPPASAIRKQLKVAQMEALYEATFLRIFSAYEAFLEDAMIHFMANYFDGSYIPVAPASANLSNSIAAATSKLYGSRDYLLWHNPSTAIHRSALHLVNSPIETALSANQQKLTDYATIRHHIAHNSTDSRRKFANAASRLTGNEHGRRPGKLLRAANNSDPLNPTKWVRLITDDIASTVLQICA